MNKLCKLVAVLAALCVASAAMALGASAAKPHGTKGDKGAKKAKPTGVRADPSFGRDGIAQIATPEPAAGSGLGDGVQMAFGPEGRVYALQGLLVLAFGPDGKPDRSFGTNGRVKIESPRGEVKPTGLAVDSQGRILISGTVVLTPYTSDPAIPAGAPGLELRTLREAFVVRLLTDGSHDPTFGVGGETDTTFNLPRPTGEAGKVVEYERPLVEATTLTVDGQDRPVLGGSFINAIYLCGYSNERPTAYVGRLTANGGIDTSFAGRGYTTGVNGSVVAMAPTPEGGVATLSTGSNCGPKEFGEQSTFDALAESGGPSPALDPARPTFYASHEIAVDPEGRALAIQAQDLFSESSLKLLRLQPGGSVDTSFGFGGGIPLQKPVSAASALTVDGKSRPILALGNSLARYTAAGRRDPAFGKNGLTSIAAAGAESTTITSVGVHGQGRIYAAAWVKNPSLKTGFGIKIARLLPSR